MGDAKLRLTSTKIGEQARGNNSQERSQEVIVPRSYQHGLKSLPPYLTDQFRKSAAR